MGLQSRDLAWVPIPRLAGVHVQGADHPTVQLHPCSRSPTRPTSCSRLIGLADTGRRRGAAALGQRVGPDAQAVEDGQERLAQGPCAVAFSQRLPAAIRNIKLEPDWQEFTQVLVSEGVCAALSVPVELDGGVIGTLDIYARQPRDWDPSEVAALQAYAGLVASLLSAAVTAQVKGRLADQLQAALEHRWLIEQAKGGAGQAKERENGS